MNYWTELSIEFANSRNYLDELYRVYPMTQNSQRKIDTSILNKINKNIESRNNEDLIHVLLELELFPLKDSYVAYLRRDKSSISRNPKTISRIASMVYEIGFDEVVERASQPKETNRQIGPMFKNWIAQNYLGFPVTDNEKDFLGSTSDMIFNSSDSEMMKFAFKYLGFDRDKGLDFIARISGKYIIAEAKFLTDFGGHQNAQYADAISTMMSPLKENKLNAEVRQIAILDGVLFIKANNKMFNSLKNYDEYPIISSLLLRDYLHSI